MISEIFARILGISYFLKGFIKIRFFPEKSSPRTLFFQKSNIFSPFFAIFRIFSGFSGFSRNRPVPEIHLAFISQKWISQTPASPGFREKSRKSAKIVKNRQKTPFFRDFGGPEFPETRSCSPIP